MDKFDAMNIAINTVKGKPWPIKNATQAGIYDRLSSIDWVEFLNKFVDEKSGYFFQEECADAIVKRIRTAIYRGE